MFSVLIPFTHFWPMLPFYIPILHSTEGIQFSGVFRGYKMRKLIRNGIKRIKILFVRMSLYYKKKSSSYLEISD